MIATVNFQLPLLRRPLGRRLASADNIMLMCVHREACSFIHFHLLSNTLSPIFSRFFITHTNTTIATKTHHSERDGKKRRLARKRERRQRLAHSTSWTKKTILQSSILIFLYFVLIFSSICHAQHLKSLVTLREPFWKTECSTRCTRTRHPE